MKILSLNNGQVFINGDWCKKNLLVKKGKIASISESPFSEGVILDCQGKWVLPGAIDPHVHFRTPGMEHKEDWVSGSKAAVSGGFTSVLDMPNTNPPTTTKDTLNEKRRIASRDSLVNFGFHFGATQNNLDELRTVEQIASIKIYYGSSTGTLLVSEQDYLKQILETTRFLVSFHAEDEALIVRNSQLWDSQSDNPKVHGLIRSVEVASSAVEKILNLAKPYPSPLYFCHVSTQNELELIQQAKTERVIYSEATPHHLFLAEDLLDKIGNFGKVNPPLRSETNREYLYQALLKGDIDTIGTDHAPHTREEKERSYKKAPAGLPGIETAIPLLLTEVIENKLSIKQFVKVCCENPAQIFSINSKGSIQPGYDADLIIIDPTEKYILESKQLHSKVAWTPFEGHKVQGRVETTLVLGKIVYHKGEFFIHLGQELTFQSNQKNK